MLSSFILYILSFLLRFLNFLIPNFDFFSEKIYTALEKVNEYIVIVNEAIPGLWNLLLGFIYSIIIYEFIFVSLITIKRGINFVRGSGKL